MAQRSFDTPPTTNSTGSGAGILQHGWHVLRIKDPTVTMSNGVRRLIFTVVSVSPHSAGQDLRNCRFSIDHKIYDALGWAARVPPHDDEDDAAIVAAVDGRILRAECKPQKNDPKYREIGWPQRPSDEDLAACDLTPPAPPKAPASRYTDDDDLPF